MNEEERYLFDLMGYLVVPDVLSAAECAELNGLVDDLDLWGRAVRGETGEIHEHNHAWIYHPETWAAPFRQLIDHPKILPYLVELVGPTVRYDHGYALLMRKGGASLRLHGGATPYNPTMSYAWHDQRMANGLVVVSFALGNVGKGDGGFAAVPGSHKSNLPLPRQFLRFEKTGSWLQQVPQTAGSAILFTEALTHGTWPWTAETERRSLLYKYTPGHMQWDHELPVKDVADANWTEQQLRLLERPYVSTRKNVRENG